MKSLNNQMTLKRRLITAFLITLLLPTFLFTIVVAVTLTNSSSGAADFKSNWLQAFIIMAIMICLTAVVLVFWLYRSIIRPLNILTDATYKIRDGELDFSIPTDTSSNDELEMLLEDFEEMRRKLKEQIDARLQYEQDTVVLISNISHDLKTPLTAIKGYTEGILDGVADTPEKQKKYLKTIYTKANDMTVLVDELAFFSKIDTNVIPYNFSIISVDDFLFDCVEELSLDTEIKGVSLSYISGIKTEGLVIADVEQLRRVLNNCISNSVKYMGKPSGDILIHSSDEGDYVRISVTDNGSGIDKKDISQIFDRFFRADASRNSKKGGTGLGLAIAKKIIEDHSGSISATSVLGEGTSIYFTLPRAETQKAEAEVTELEAKPEAAKPRRSGNAKHEPDKKHTTDNTLPAAAESIQPAEENRKTDVHAKNSLASAFKEVVEEEKIPRRKRRKRGSSQNNTEKNTGSTNESASPDSLINMLNGSKDSSDADKIPAGGDRRKNGERRDRDRRSYNVRTGGPMPYDRRKGERRTDKRRSSDKAETKTQD